jgi:hypothetical protein
MVLHASRESFGISPLTSSFFHQSLDAISWISEKFNKKIEQVNVEAVSPFPPHSITLAALELDRMWRETGDLKYLDRANSLITMLRFFSRRWLGASMYFEDWFWRDELTV